MSATTISVRLPVTDALPANTLPSPVKLVGGVAEFFRSRWVYHVTLAKIGNY